MTRSPGATVMNAVQGPTMVRGNVHGEWRVWGADAPGFVRMSYATSMEHLREGSRRLLEFVQKHAPTAARV